jgi:predicted RNA binding protein YcfA (HicA-like mRNA interferase family)
VKVRELIRILERDGWEFVVMQGSHQQFKHPRKPGRVTEAGNLGKDVPSETLNNIWKQAGLKEKHS